MQQTKENLLRVKNNRAITLIALVITIIVLLILAGVTIVTLTGDNGLLAKANSAKTSSLEAEIEEEIRLAWNKVYADSYIGNLSAEQKASALQAELIGKDPNATVTASGNELRVKYRGKDKVLDISTGTFAEPISAVAKAKRDGTVFDEGNTPITDEFGNTFIVPKGFKIASDSADNVPGGIVIEDATYTNTIGSQFVWIPVSRDSTEANKIKGEKNTTILLGRYVFNSDGTVNSTLSKSNPQDQLKTSSLNKGFSLGRRDTITTRRSGEDVKDRNTKLLLAKGGSTTPTYYYTEGLSNSTTTNVDAKDINDFVSKTNAAGGFWIGRYEARTGTARNDTGNTLTQITEKGNDYVYNQVSQSQAAGQAQGMYASNNYFESDLINSYAWDTATLFLQEYDNREGENLTKYSQQNSLNFDLVTTGTTTDRICNVYDMASNCWEWSTESYSNASKPCVKR